MGCSPSKPAPTPPPLKRTNSAWLDSLVPSRARKTLFHPFGTPSSSSSAVVEIPPDNIFIRIQEDNILPQIPIGRHHPVPRTGVEDDDKRTMNTNKFYANVFLGKQNRPVWTQPYAVWWGKGRDEPGMMKSFGMCVSHVEESDLIYGEGDPAKSYTNPLSQSLILSAKELDAQTTLTSDTHTPFSVNINLRIPSSPEPKITFPLVQGMAFVTAGYRTATPTIQTSSKGFVDVSNPITLGKSFKYRVQDCAGRSWLVYINPVPDVSYDAGKFFQLDPNTIIGPPGFKGTIKVAKNPLGAEGEAIYDRACGSFVTSAKLTAVVNDTKGSYSFQYSKIGTAPLLIFGLPHHIQSLDPELKAQVSKLQLRTTTKGLATAIWAEKVTCVEPNLPVNMGFAPWTPGMTTKPRYTPEVLALIAAVAERDLRRAMTEPIPQDSMYYAGKSLAKFATIVWVCRDILSNEPLTSLGLEKLKLEMSRWVANQQLHPLYYDDTWKGVVSNAGFTDANADFGNTYYNDHHFHFAYFVYTAAVIGYLDPGWLTQGDNKAWTNMLVKDFSEAEYDGRDFPWQRSFDWWHGHSWAKGLYEAADGKDQESTSEDGWSGFAVKMWGRVSGDGMMEKRGNLTLALQARSFSNYFYLQSANTNHPPRFTPNKITGILFENKVDYTTYFGTAPSLIHAIHILPLSPATSYLRPRAFVKEEWDQFFSNGRANVDGGWRGILYANLALIDARASYTFFRDGINGFWDESWIDGGASRTWYLVWAAGLGVDVRR
ncbi:hypothetical protein HBH70_188430 [Parastagonospora nodorum]|nr:hypothetical protein HBI78_218670 [Parastagonospora nodorum]KAH5130762.1 hypothetical protein HBH70_188430 [Parastagonospora nodorum]KAH5147774.1 hypothetical protein HBH69_167090 [Parastagonospora nodorum]KAH5173577.1 hypothetical protein HBH77_207900 [Parastagonospora nodorum]